MIKNILVIAVILLGMTACKQDPAYKLTACINGMPDGLKVVLRDDATRQVLDSTRTKDGKFEFSGKLEMPIRAGIDIETPGEMFSGKLYLLFLENADIQMQADWNSYKTLRIKSSKLQDLYDSYSALSKSLDKQLAELEEKEYMLYGQYLDNGSLKEEHIKAGIEIAEKQEQIQTELYRIDQKFIKEHPNSLVSLTILQDKLRSRSVLTNIELDKLLQEIGEEVKSTSAYKKVEKLVKEYRATAKGEKFMDFRVMDIDGKEGMFSDYIQPGKLNMLECWASWCGFCRREIPHLKLVHQKYVKDLNIIAISIDANADEWRRAMKEDNAPYIQLLALKDSDGKNIGDYYDFSGIPYTLLIDGNGKILTDKARGNALDLLLLNHIGR